MSVPLLVVVVWLCASNVANADDPQRMGFFVGTSANDFNGSAAGSDVVSDGETNVDWSQLSMQALPQSVDFVDFYFSLEEAQGFNNSQNFSLGWQATSAISLDVQDGQGGQITNGQWLNVAVGFENQLQFHVTIECLVNNDTGYASLDVGVPMFSEFDILFTYNCTGSTLFRRGFNVGLGELDPNTLIDNGEPTGNNVSYGDSIDQAALECFFSDFGPKNSTLSFGVAVDTPEVNLEARVLTPFLTLQEDVREPITIQFLCNQGNPVATRNLVTVSILFNTSRYTDVSFTLLKDCPPGVPEVPCCDGGGGGLSGWETFGIICFVAVLLALLACCGGYVYNYTALRKRGLDAVPCSTIFERCAGTHLPRGAYSAQVDLGNDAHSAYGTYSAAPTTAAP